MIQIFANSKEDGRQEIVDMYWFEENGVHSLDDGEGTWGQHYWFEIFVNGFLLITIGKAE
jgi:hypothetical protein